MQILDIHITEPNFALERTCAERIPRTSGETPEFDIQAIIYLANFTFLAKLEHPKILPDARKLAVKIGSAKSLKRGWCNLNANNAPTF